MSVVVLTGASRGIGVPLALRLASRGHVVLAARGTEGLEATAGRVREAGGEATICAGDVTDPAYREALCATAERIGPVTALVNNAGVEFPKAVLDQSDAQVALQLAVNLEAPIALTRRLVPGMVERGRGAVAMVSSMSGKSPTPYNAIYTATKHGINGFTASLRIELEGTGVHAGVVCPSFVADAGMWADGGSQAPAMLREVSLDAVCHAVERVLDGKPELLVTPTPVRPMLALAQLFPSLDRKLLGWLGVLPVLRQRATDAD